MHDHDKSASSQDVPSVKSQDAGSTEISSSRDPSVKSHDFNHEGAEVSTSGGGGGSDQPLGPSTSENHREAYVSDNRGTDASFRPWEKPFGNDMLDIKQYQGIDTYEVRLRIREQEAIQMMIEKQKELIRQREEDEMKLRERILRELEREAQRGKYLQNEDLLEKSKPENEMSYKSPYNIDELHVSSDKVSRREFRTPERHVPNISQSTGRSRSHDHSTSQSMARSKSHEQRNISTTRNSSHDQRIDQSTGRTKSHDQKTESGYYDSEATRYDGRESTNRSGGKTSYEENETQPVKGDRSSTRQSSYQNQKEPRETIDEFYSQRRSPYGAATNGTNAGWKGSISRSPYTAETGLASNSESDRVQSDDFQPLQVEQV